MTSKPHLVLVFLPEANCSLPALWSTRQSFSIMLEATSNRWITNNNTKKMQKPWHYIDRNKDPCLQLESWDKKGEALLGPSHWVTHVCFAALCVSPNDSGAPWEWLLGYPHISATPWVSAQHLWPEARHHVQAALLLLFHSNIGLLPAYPDPPHRRVTQTSLRATSSFLG